MAGTTNRIELEEAADMVGRARACVAVVVDGRPQIEPAVARLDGDHFLVGVPADSTLADGVTEAVLVIDEGVLFFDLRAIYVRGHPVPTPPDERADGDELTWFEIEPATLTCWDYGRLRRADGPH